MFKHSVKVPRLYKTAAKVAKEVKEGIGSIKQLVYEYRSKHPNIKAIYALVATLFQRSDEIENLLKRSQFLVKEPRSDPWLTKILIVELLWGKKCLPGNSKPEKTVLAYEQIFKAHMSDGLLATEENESDNKDEFKPRYVRVNTLKITSGEAVDGFRDEGWVLNKFLDNKDYDKFLEKITTLAEEEFLVDIHIPNLLIFPPRTHFYNHPAYKNGSIILQDKASCLPVHILGPPPGSVVLDMCAAPGMKTTQVAALIKDQGQVYAVERDPRRFETLNRIVESSGATCVTTVNKDVLTCNQKDFPGVQYILVDPSCSGSGIMGRMEFEQSKSNGRIEKLAGFQIKILRSALTRYPEAKRVVYSTCSVFPEENEDVVRQVLETNATFKLVPAMKFVNDTWKNFGSPEYGNLGSYCLYAKPREDLTNGFFVAVFERLEEGEENEFFNTKIYNFKKHVQHQEKRKMRQQQLVNNENKFDTEKNQSYQGYGDLDVEAQGTNELKNDTNSSVKRRKHKEINDVKVGKVKEDKSDEEAGDNSENKSRKKKKKRSHIPDQVDNVADMKVKKEEKDIVDTKNVYQKIKKKKNKQQFLEDVNTGAILKEEESEDRFFAAEDSVRKKKKKRSEADQSLQPDNVADDDVKLENEELGTVNDNTVGKKKKKRKYDTVVEAIEVDDGTKDVIKTEGLEIGSADINEERKRKKKKKKELFVMENSVISNDECAIEQENKKIKKKKKHDGV